MQTPRPHQPGLASADDGLESKEDGTREEERRKIATLLQDHMRAVEQSEKLSEQERQRSSALHDQFCQTLENVLPKKTKPPHAKTKHVAANSSPKDLANIQTLKEQIDENQKEISGLSEKQQKLISDVLTVFAGHKDKSDEILQKLQQEKTVKVQDLRQSRILFKHANDHVEELKVESAKKAPHFQGCRSSIANAGKFYRLGYRSIIALVEQQPALDNLQIKSENSVHGSNIISPNVYIGDKVIGLEDKLEEIQAEFDKVGDQYNALQRDHQENMKKLKTLKLQQVDLSQYERDLLTRLADAQQYVRNSKTKEGKIEKQRKAKQQRIVELEAEIAQKTAEIRDLQSNSSPAGQAQLGHQNTKAKHDEDSKDPIPVQNLSERQIINNALRESRYDGDGALKLALKEIPSADYYTRSAAWQMLHILAKNSQLSQQQTTQVFAIATARLKHDDWYHAWETLLTLAGSSSHLSEAQIISILATVAEGLKDKVAGVRGAAERTLAALAGNQHLSEQRINQMLTTATVGLQNKDKDTWEMLAALAGSSRLSDQQIAKLLATATAGLKNNDEEVQAAAQQTLATLASNPRLSDRQIAEILDAAITGLEDEYNQARCVGRQRTLRVLLANPRLSKQQIAQISAAIVNGLKNKNGSVILAQIQQTLLLRELTDNPRVFESQTAQILAAAIPNLKDEYWHVRSTVHEILTALAGNALLSDQQVAQLLAVATAGLKDEESTTQRASQKIPVALAGNSRLSKSQVVQIFTTVTAGLKDANRDVRMAIWEQFAALASNAHLSESQVTQIFTIITAGLEDADRDVRMAAWKQFAALAGNARLSESQVAQISAMAIVGLKDKDLKAAIGGPPSSGWKGRDTEALASPQKALTALVSNPRSSEPQIAQIFTTTIDALRYGDVAVKYAAADTLVALASNPRLSEQQAAQIPSVIIFAFKHEDNLRSIFTRNLIQRIKDCSLNQLPRYTALANTVMQDADICSQLIAISLLTAIHQRSENASQPSQGILAAAAAAMGLMPKPKPARGQAPNNNTPDPRAASAPAADNCSIS